MLFYYTTLLRFCCFSIFLNLISTRVKLGFPCCVVVHSIQTEPETRLNFFDCEVNNTKQQQQYTGPMLLGTAEVDLIEIK